MSGKKPKSRMGWPDAQKLFGGAQKPQITSSTLRTFAKHTGMTEEEALRKIEEIAGGKVEVTDPTEPFVVIVSDYLAVPGSRSVDCSLCGAKCWAAEAYGPLATYLCIECSQQGSLDGAAPPKHDA